MQPSLHAILIKIIPVMITRLNYHHIVLLLPRSMIKSMLAATSIIECSETAHMTHLLITCSGECDASLGPDKLLSL